MTAGWDLMRRHTRRISDTLRRSPSPSPTKHHVASMFMNSSHDVIRLKLGDSVQAVYKGGEEGWQDGNMIASFFYFGFFSSVFRSFFCPSTLVFETQFY